MLYQRWKQGESFQGRELAMLLPERQDFVAVWRYLSAHAASNLFRESPTRLARNISRSAGQRETYAPVSYTHLGLDRPGVPGQVLAEYADLAAIGTVADVMSLTDENRAIVAMGLRALADRCV